MWLWLMLANVMANNTYTLITNLVRLKIHNFFVNTIYLLVTGGDWFLPLSTQLLLKSNFMVLASSTTCISTTNLQVCCCNCKPNY